MPPIRCQTHVKTLPMTTDERDLLWRNIDTVERRTLPSVVEHNYTWWSLYTVELERIPVRLY